MNGQEQGQVKQVQVSPRECIVGVIDILGKIPVPIELDEMIRQPILIARGNLINYLRWRDEQEAERIRAADGVGTVDAETETAAEDGEQAQ